MEGVDEEGEEVGFRAEEPRAQRGMFGVQENGGEVV